MVDRVPEELWMEDNNTLEEEITKTIPKKKKCKKANWLSDQALQTAEKRREAKGKGKRERDIQVNAELQRIARRDEKAFLSDLCKEIEENNRMGKTSISRKLERYQGKCSCEVQHNKEQTQKGPNRSRRD